MVYWPYGEVQSLTGVELPVQFVGALGYYTAAQNRVYVRARWYRPDLGRWQTADPIGIAARARSAYEYVTSQPVGVPDPSGAECRSNSNNCEEPGGGGDGCTQRDRRSWRPPVCTPGDLARPGVRECLRSMRGSALRMIEVFCGQRQSPPGYGDNPSLNVAAVLCCNFRVPGSGCAGPRRSCRSKFFTCLAWDNPCLNGAAPACAQQCYYEHEAVHAADCDAQDRTRPDPGTYSVDTECRAWTALVNCVNRLLGGAQPLRSGAGGGRRARAARDA